MSWTTKDTAAHDGVSVKTATRAEHQARNDAAASGELPERNANKTSDSESGGFLNFLSRLAGFGGNDRKEGGGDGGSFG